MYPPPAIKTSHTELLGTTAGLILTAVAAVAGLAVMIGAVFLADAQPDIRRLVARRRELGGRGPGTGLSLGQGGTPEEQIEHRHVPEGGHPHGKPASWVLVAVVIAAFTAGGIAIITHAWWLMWTCAGIIVLAIPAGKVVGIMNDTVGGDSTPLAAHDSSQDQGADSRREQRAPAQR